MALVCVSIALYSCVGVAAEKITLRYWDFMNPKGKGPRSIALRTILQNFEARNPNVEIAVEVLPWDKIGERLIASVAAHKGPDVVRVLWNELPFIVNARALVPFDEFVSNWTKEQKEDWVIDWNATVFDGKKMAFFLDTRARVLYYRKDLLEKAGYVGPPKSLDELATAAGAITTQNVTGMGIGLSTKKFGQNVAMWFLPTLIGSGGKFLNDDGSAAFNGPAGVRAFQWLYDLIYKHKGMSIDLIGWGVEDVYNGFKAGTVGMEIETTTRVKSARRAQALGENFKTAPLPSFTPGVPSPSINYGFLLGISRDCKDKNAAWGFIQHMLSKESQLIYAKAGEMPSRKSVYDDPYFKTPEAAEIRMMSEYMTKHGTVVRMGPNWTFFTRHLALAAQEMVTKHVPPKQVLDDVAKKYNAEIGEK
jgi:ABC-type glycerol-3-phosphate transport system substrate-binding protein